MSENPIDKQLGINLRRLREARSISREALGSALRSPVSGTAIEKYEAGVNRVSGSTLVEIAGFFRCRVSDFFDGIPQVIKDYESLEHKVVENPKVREAVANLCKAIILEMSDGFKREAVK